MTDYSKMDHQALYDYVHSGNPDSMNSTAQAWQSHYQELEQATSELQSNLTAIQSQWSGAAADAYFQQSQDVANKMQTHADNAANTSTAVTNTASALSWARSNMPHPPSWLEQQTANIDSNFVTGAIGFLSTDGAATAASELAKHDIANKHQQAISVMTQLAGAYSSARAQLPVRSSSRIDDPTNGNGNGNGNGNSNPPMMPVPIYPVGSAGGGGEGSGDGGGGYSGGGSTSGHYGGGSGVAIGGGSSSSSGGSTGGGLSVKPPTFSDPGGATNTQGVGGGGNSGSGFTDTPNPYSTSGGTAGGYGSGGLGQFGGAGSGTAGLPGAGAFGAGGFGSDGAGGGYGGSGYGAGRSGLGKGGTSLGAGEGDISTGGGDVRGNTNGRYGSTAAAGEEEALAGGAAEGKGQGQSGGMMGGGMGGRGGAGGGSEERGNRAAYLRQDPDYWYGDKQAAPPGGVIE